MAGRFHPFGARSHHVHEASRLVYPAALQEFDPVSWRLRIAIKTAAVVGLPATARRIGSAGSEPS
jgi:hypothetical protein